MRQNFLKLPNPLTPTLSPPGRGGHCAGARLLRLPRLFNIPHFTLPADGFGSLLDHQYRNTGQRLAFERFQERAAGG
jgi:hypothetical protein